MSKQPMVGRNFAFFLVRQTLVASIGLAVHEIEHNAVYHYLSLSYSMHANPMSINVAMR